MPRTNIVIDDALVSEGLALSHLHTRRALVDQALRVYIERLRMQRLRELRGQVEFEPGYDPTARRPRRGDEARA
jgi:Arc/MetJ family transcription regulator